MQSGNGKQVDSLSNQPRTKNESGELSPRSAASTPQQSSLRRTLLFAGVFALLAMIYVPMPKHGYRLIFDRSDTSIAFFQLLVNVGFAALVGGLVANLPWRRAWFRRGIYLVGACLTIAVGIIAFTQIREDAVAQAGSDALYADYLLRTVHDGVRAKDYFLHAADNWHIAGDTVQEQRARQRANNAYQDAAAAKEAAAKKAAAAEQKAAAAREAAEREAAAAREAAEWARIYQHNAQYNDAVERGDLGAMKMAEAELRALGVNPWDEYLRAKKRKQEDEDCRKEIQLHKWDHWTDAGKTFMIGTFFERQLGDRKKDVDAVAKQIGARFYKVWEHHKRGDIEEVKVVFYK
jgi:hypothetical protein